MGINIHTSTYYGGIHPIFARHDTFHPRFGWLKKGFDKAVEDKSVFSKKTASVVLGVGKNMVKAIRYWCIAFKIVDEIKDNGKAVHIPTPFAERLLKKNGWDPYLENPASLWLLHWNLFKSPCYAPAWHFAFNGFNRLDFSTEDLLFSLKEYNSHTFPTKNIHDSSLQKDISCLLRMYVEKSSPRALKEDTIDCPFTELGIIASYNNSKRYAFNFGGKPTLAYEMIVHACLEFAASFQDDAKTISISRLLYDAGSPGQVFKLNESALCEAIEHVSNKNNDFILTDTAGMFQFAYKKDPLEISDKLLKDFFSQGK